MEMMDGRLLSRVAYTGRRPSWRRRKEGGYGVERTGNLATEKNNVGKKGAWVEHRDEWFWEEKERKEEELRHEVRSAALGRSIIQEGQNDGACLKRLEGMTARVAEDACSLLSRYGGRVGEVWLNVGSALFAPHIDLHHNVCFSWRYKCDVEGWQDMLKAAEKGVLVGRWGPAIGSGIWRPSVWCAEVNREETKKAMPDVTMTQAVELKVEDG